MLLLIEIIFRLNIWCQAAEEIYFWVLKLNEIANLGLNVN